MDNTLWSKSGATLSDKSARKEFGITQDEIIQGINDGRLQYREHNMHGNPWFRLLRSEVECFVRDTRGACFLKMRLVRNELEYIETDLRKAKAHVASLNVRKAELVAELETL